MVMIMGLFFIMLFFGIIRMAFRFAWSLTKFFFGLGLFFVCPLLFVTLMFFGILGNLWIPILIFAIILGGGFRYY